MIKKVQDIYPSSNVPESVIAAYGWSLIEVLPARVNKQGYTVPVAEASEYLRTLRAEIDERATLPIATDSGVLNIEDFAVAPIAGSTTRQLGFFGLLPN